MMGAHIPISLYIHMPWCVKKCPYCDFNSHGTFGSLPEAEYIQALFSDLDQDLNSFPFLKEKEFSSIFFGGGTPSLFSTNNIGKIIEGVSNRLKLSSQVEITMEANPGTLEHKNFSDYVNAGINRISLGVQSFQNDKLEALGRIHQSHEVEKALESIHRASLKSFNIDLMYGLPNQTIEDALFDLKKALSFSPPHLSWYNLTLEPNTVFHAKPPVLPSEELIADMQETGFLLLKEAGFHHYEVSAFAKPMHHCVHNLNYWQFGDYLGIGAGAHGKITLQDPINILTTSPNHFSIIRRAKKRYPKNYLATDQFLADTESRTLSSQEIPFEFMLNALRLCDGFSEHLFEERTGISLETLSPTLHQAKTQDLLIWENGKIVPSPLGQRFLNNLMTIFLQEK